MGSIRKRRKSYSTPSHPWRKERIDEEKKITEDYALSNKKEIWKADAVLKKFFRQAKKLINLDSKQAESERKQLLDGIVSLRLLDATAKVEDVLSLDLRAVLDRRLQTIVFKKGLARSIKQARQFVVHRHITVDGKILGSPSYLVRIADEDKIAFCPNSGLADDMHPERKQEKKEVKKETKEDKKKDSTKDKKSDKEKPAKKEEKKEEKKSKKEDKKPKEEKKEEKKPESDKKEKKQEETKEK